MLRRLIDFGFYCLVLAVASSAQDNEEVLFFDAGDAQTGTANGGTVIFPMESGVWRFWFQDVYGAAVSPDGRSVAYRFQNSINIAPLDGQNPKTIALNAPGGPLSWSPSGDRISYFAQDELIIMDLEGQIVATHKELSILNLQPPSWSPDGSRIAVLRGGTTSEAHSVFVLDVATGGYTELYEPIRIFGESSRKVEGFHFPVWSPDGEKIAVLRHYDEAAGRDWRIDNTNLAILPASGGRPTLVTSYPSYTDASGFVSIGAIAWSPDGSELAYSVGTSSSQATPGTYRIAVGGGAPTKINGFLPATTRSGQGEFANWSTALHWVVLNPTPTVSLVLGITKPVGDSGNLSIGDIITTRITIRSDHPEPVTVTFAGSPLQTDQTALLSIEENESETFVLSEAQPEKSLEVEVEMTASGTAKLFSEIEFIKDGETMSKRAEMEIVIPALELSLQAIPLQGGKPLRDLEINQDGIITTKDGLEVDPMIKVTVENRATQDMNVILQSVDPRARDKSAILGRITTVTEFPIDLGTIPAGGKVTREIDIDILQDGRYEFTVLATGFFSGSTRQFNSSDQGSPLAVGEPFPVEVEMEFVRTPTITNQRVNAFFVTPGGAIKIIATVRNKTTNKTLHFKGIEAEKRGNAFGSRLTSEDGNLVDPPFVHDHEVDAGSAAILSGLIQTDANGAPKGTVKWIMPEEAYLIDDESEERTDLSPDDFLVVTEIDDWLSGENSLRIIQDFSRPYPVELTDLEFAFLRAGNFTEAALISMAKWTYDTYDVIGGIGRVAGTVAADPSLLSDAIGEGARSVWESAELIHLGWTSMTPNEKDAFILAVSDETYRRAQYIVDLATSLETQADAVAYARNATFGLFNGVSEAYATDDPEQIARLIGNISGNVAMEVMTGFLPTPKFTRYVDGAELAKLAEAADNIRTLNQQQRILRNVPAGPIGRGLAIDGWGIGGQHLDDVQSVLRQLNMKGYARERAPRSITLSETLDEAVLKPQAMKPKGFSDLDRLILGDDVPTVKGKSGADLDLDAITVVMWPPENSVIRSRLALAGESEDVIKAALARADSRRKEYKKRFPEFKQYRDGGVDADGNPVPKGIPIEFDYKSNDSIPTRPNHPPDARRRFDFDTIETSNGAVIHVPKMGNASDELRYITGDVDWIHFSWLDGTPLDSATAGKLYEILEVCCGLQHGETVTWINKGQAVFEGKASQIGEYLTGPNQKALLEVTGQSIRAVRIRPNLTRFAKNSRNHLIFFDGGTKAMQKALKAAELEHAIALITNKLPSQIVLLPFMWFAKNANFDEDSSIDGQDWTYSDDPDAVMARQSKEGTLERFDGQSWIPWNPRNANANRGTPMGSVLFSENPPGNTTRLNLTPTTVLSEAALSGQTALPIANLAELWADELEGHLNAWFKPGDNIVIAPGTPQQENRRLITISPFTVDYPLTSTHPEDTIVAVVPESLATAIDPIKFVVTFGNPLVSPDGVSFGFNIPQDGRIIFETSPNLEDWEPIAADSLTGGRVEQGVAVPEYAGGPVFVFLGYSTNKMFLRWKEE